MPRYYLDSSALVKRYHNESGSPAVDALFKAAGNRFLISRLALVEAQSSFARLVREGVLTQGDFHSLQLRLQADVSDHTLLVAATSSRRLEGATKILATHGLAKNIRSLDAIHLATAEALNARSRLAGFVAADKKLLDVAEQSCGLTIVDVS